MNGSGTVCGLVDRKFGHNQEKLCQCVCMRCCVFDEALYRVRRDWRAGSDLARFILLHPPLGVPEKKISIFTPPPS